MAHKACMSQGDVAGCDRRDCARAHTSRTLTYQRGVRRVFRGEPDQTTPKEVTTMKITIRKLERIETTAISTGGCCGCYDC